MIMLTCSTCRESKPEGEFHRNATNPTGRQRRCKSCNTAQVIAWQRANPEKHQAKQRRSDLKRKYGITVERYAALLDQQGGVCKICGRGPSGTGSRGNPRSLVVDHDHETGAVRGLLCDQCNRGIGYLGDSLSRLYRARAYLSQ